MVGQATLVAAFQFVVEQQGQELDGGELALDGLGGSEVEGFQQPRQAELAQFG
jgi:hypothetical protein